LFTESIQLRKETNCICTVPTNLYLFTYDTKGNPMYLHRLTKSLLILVLLASLLGLSLPAQAQSAGLRIQYRAADTNAGDNQIKPHFNIVNQGGSAVPLSELKIRYWFTREGTAGQNFWCDWSAIIGSCSNVTGTFVQVSPARPGADFYLEVGFAPAAGSIAAGGQSGEIHTRVSKSDWSNYTETGDYSFDPTKTSFADWTAVTLYRNGALVWGNEPGDTPVPTPTNTQPGPTNIPTRTPTRTNTPIGPTPTRTPTQSSGSQVFQAENTSFGGGATADSNNSGFNGTGFINFPASGGFLQFNNVSGGSGGNASLQFRYALGATGSRTGLLIVNGASQSITFQPTGAWTTWSTHTVNVSLNGGTGNTVRLESNGQDLANIDQLTVTVGGGPTPTRTNTPIGPTPTRTNTPIGPTSTRTPTQPSGSAIYVAPNGSDSAPGTISQPTTLTAAIGRVIPGGTILMRGGTYNFSTPVIVARGNNGTSSARKQLFANPGETPVLNFSAMALDSANRGLTINGHYWHVRGLIVERAGDNGIFIGGNNNIIERCVTRFNRDSGLQLSRHSSSAPFSEWPANNLIISCESHDNADPDGEDADGFAAKLTVGEGNVFRYDVAHNNIDDGWDLYTKTDTGPIGRVTIEDSISFRNGTLSDGSTAGNGDRNGYKLGGEDISVNHIIRRNLAYLNGKHGFTYNRNLGTIEMTANVSIDSTERNFNFDGGTSVFRNNVSCRSSSGTNDRIIGNADSSNFFWMGSNTSPQCASFTGTFTWQFNADGSLSWSFR